MTTFVEILRGSGISIGTATNIYADDAKYNDIRQSHFDLYVPEWSFKWEATEPTRGVISLYSEAYKLFELATSEKRKFKGHCLVWNQVLPQWYKNLSIDEKKKAIEFHVRNMVKRFKGKIYKWDVVNEALDYGNKLRPFWQELGGLEMIKKCFIWAHEEDPSAILVYNDFDCTCLNPRSTDIFNMIKALRDQGCPIHEIGMQSHENIEYMDDKWIESIKANMRRYKDIGMRCNISELDLRCDKYPGTLQEKFQKQADVYYKFFKAVLSDLSVCNEVSFWNFASKYSWIYGYYNVDRQYCPLPWDNNLNPTPSYHAIKKALQEIVSYQKPPVSTPTPVPIPTPSPPPVSTPTPITLANVKWENIECKQFTYYKTTKRLYTWSGPIMQLASNKKHNFHVTVDSPTDVKITLKYTDDNVNWSYRHLQSGKGFFNLTFTTPIAKHVYIYIEGPEPSIDFYYTTPRIQIL